MVLEFLPMHGGPMSCYTVCAIAIMASAGLLFATIYIRYNSNEFRRTDKRIDGLKAAIGGHDDYIDDTTTVINQIHIDLAVQKSSMIDLKNDIAEIKADIKTLLKR